MAVPTGQKFFTWSTLDDKRGLQVYPTTSIWEFWSPINLASHVWIESYAHKLLGGKYSVWQWIFQDST